MKKLIVLAGICMGLSSVAWAGDLGSFIRFTAGQTSCHQDEHRHTVCEFLNMSDPQFNEKIKFYINGELVPQFSCAANDFAYYMDQDDVVRAQAAGLHTDGTPNTIKIEQCANQSCTVTDNTMTYSFAITKEGSSFVANPSYQYDNLSQDGVRCS